MKFTYYLGIDQTGAVTPKGVPKSLWVCVIRSSDQKTWINQQIKNLTHNEIKNLFDRIGIKLNIADKVLICVDAVLGLAAELKITPQAIIKKAKNFAYDHKEYGAQTAYQFYRSFLNEDQQINLPHRLVEIHFKANSVFNLKPFQRNIGCGSYRILKNLSIEKKWFSIWPFENIEKSQFVICEGYPSYFWKVLFNQPSRRIEFFHKSPHEFKNLDQADSYVLAYGARELFKKHGMIKLSKQLMKEGWIWGVPI